MPEKPGTGGGSAFQPGRPKVSIEEPLTGDPQVDGGLLPPQITPSLLALLSRIQAIEGQQFGQRKTIIELEAEIAGRIAQAEGVRVSLLRSLEVQLDVLGYLKGHLVDGTPEMNFWQSLYDQNLRMTRTLEA